jgi:HSP20 family molecular chaperone IbpA
MAAPSSNSGLRNGDLEQHESEYVDSLVNGTHAHAHPSWQDEQAYGDDSKQIAQLHQGIDDDDVIDNITPVPVHNSLYDKYAEMVNHPHNKSATQLVASNGQAPSVSLASVEDQTAIFEDILHPEMLEAVQSLEQLDFEESELTKAMRGLLLNPKKKTQPDYIQALLMEMDLRRKEKVKTMETFKRIEEERNDNTLSLIRELRNVRQRNKELMQMIETRNKRQEGNMTYNDVLDVYDWVVDISLLGDLAGEGWKVVFSEPFYQHMIENGLLESTLVGNEADDVECVNWQGAVIAVVGLYDKGKTFCLNKITNSQLPSGKKVSTKGLSFKHVNVESTNFVLLDSAGSYSPVKVVNELSVAQKEATELFLLDLIFDLSDYFIDVVNDFTSLDQRYLDKLTRSLQNSNKVFREVIVVHNLKEVTSAQVLAHVWETQVTQIYSGGSRMSTQVAAVNPDTGKLEEKHVEWFKTKYTRHICLAHEDSPIGRAINPWTISLLRYWLKSVFVPVDRQFSVVNAVIHHSNKKLSSYFKETVRLTLQPGQEDRVKYIRPPVGFKKEGLRLTQVALDASGLMLTRPDSFMPPIDVVTEDDKYCIYMDVPGLSAKDITLARQNVMTIIKGSRSQPYPQDTTIQKQERKFGEFTLTFNIPHNYERKWESVHVENGVLCIRFKQDIDDFEQVCFCVYGVLGRGSGEGVGKGYRRLLLFFSVFA